MTSELNIRKLMLGSSMLNSLKKRLEHGKYSETSANTAFAIGNGTSNTARSNLFEIADNNGQTEVIMKSPNGTKYKLTVDDSGNLSTTAI